MPDERSRPPSLLASEATLLYNAGMNITDLHERELALDPTESFIVQAPAGSGKTELLIQRYLTLLATVDQPEDIIAITFTRKAAHEMHERVISAIQKAANEPKPTEAYQLKTWELASNALAQNEKQNWQIQQNPERLKIQTIDSLCSSLTKRLPLLSKLGAQANITEDALPLYHEAARNLILDLANDSEWKSALETLLLHTDNQAQKLEDLFADMLSKRDHWLSHLFLQGESEADRRVQLEAGLQTINDEVLSDAAEFFEINSTYVEELTALARFAAVNVDVDSAIAACYGVNEQTLWALPCSRGSRSSTELECEPRAQASAHVKDTWLGIADLLLTKTGDWRKQVTKTVGFPAHSSTKDPEEKALYKSMKERMMAFLDIVKTDDELLSILRLIKTLPPEKYSDQQWQVLNALMTVLPILSAHLRLVFKEKSQVDFTEVSLAALTALGNEDAPTNLALYLDYKIQHILIDEFQDTSITQLKLLEKLTTGWEPNDGRSLFIVGDPMQSIYRFRNAEVGLFLRTQHEGIGHIRPTALSLKTNFRSQASIVNWFNHSFQHIFPTIEDVSLGAVTYSKAEAASNDKQTPAEYHLCCQSREDEAEQIIKTIRKLQTNNPNNSIAILVQARNHLNDIIPALQKAKIAFRGIDIATLATQSYILDLFALTKALLFLDDRVSWLSILRAPWCGLSLSDIHAIAQSSHDNTLWHALNKAELIDNLSDDAQGRIKALINTVQTSLNLRRRKPLSVFIKDAWLDLGGQFTLSSQHALNDCERYFQLLEQYEAGGDIINLEEFEKQLTKLFAQSEQQNNINLHIMTIHKAKGLEFDHVILPSLDRPNNKKDPQLMLWTERPRQHEGSDLILAPIKASFENKDLIYHYLYQLEKQRFEQENRRLFYVAVTRAKSQLHFFAAYKGSVPENSFLHYLQLTGDIKLEEPSIAETEEKLASRTIKRLKQVKTDKKQTLIPGENQLSPEDYQWQASISRQTGTLIHRALQQITEDGLEAWPIERIQTLSSHWKSILRANGLEAKLIPQAIKQVIKALSNAINDQQGQWILNAKQDAHAEYALSDQNKQIVIDKIFKDKDGQLWLIDFKTSHPRELSLADFLNDEKIKYQKQLSQYHKILTAHHGATPRYGLYFPLIPAWVEM